MRKEEDWKNKRGSLFVFSFEEYDDTSLLFVISDEDFYFVSCIKGPMLCKIYLTSVF